MEIGGVGIEAHAGHAVQRINDQVGVGEHYALRTARGAAGVEQAGQLVVSGPGIVQRLVAGQVLVAQQALGTGEIVEPDDLAQRRRPAVEYLQMVHHAGVDEHRHGTRVVKDVLDFGCRQPRVQRHHHRAQPGQGVHEFKIAVGIQRQDRHAVAATHVQCGKRTGDPAHAILRLPPGPPTAGEGGRNAVGTGLDGAAKSLGQCKHGTMLGARSFARQGASW